MRTWIVLAAVLAVGAAAVADALHGSLRSNAAQPAAATAVRRIVPPGVPAGFMGTVVFSDLQDGCRLHTLRLAGFENAAPPEYRGCRFSLSPDGKEAAPEGSAWSPSGDAFAVPDGRDLVLHAATDQTIRIRGTSPVFKTDGTLTYLRDGRLVEWTTRCSPGSRLFEIAFNHEASWCAQLVYPGRLESVAWLSDSRFAAITRGGEAILVDQGKILVRAQVPRKRAPRLSASPGGDYLSFWLGGELAGIFDAAGKPVRLLSIAHVRALAWSPTERWVIVATAQGTVYLLRPNAGDAQLRRLDIQARDIAWR